MSEIVIASMFLLAGRFRICVSLKGEDIIRVDLLEASVFAAAEMLFGLMLGSRATVELEVGVAK